MSRGVGIVFLLLALPAGAFRQGALNDQQRVGQTLFTQSCGVCHLKPQITATLRPPLSKESAGGSEDVMRETITNGTPRMPGFKLLFEPTQINAIVAYLKTVRCHKQRRAKLTPRRSRMNDAQAKSLSRAGLAAMVAAGLTNRN